MLSKKIKNLRIQKGKTQQELADLLNISRSTLAGYESESKQPSYEMLVKIADYFDVPTDYLLSRGAFADCVILEKAKPQVLNLISTIASRLSVDILNGVDDITYIKLVDAFSISVTENPDGTYGLTARDPFPTYPNSNEIFTKASHPSIRPNIDTELLHLISTLSHNSQIELKGYVKRMLQESVAEDVPERKASGK